MTNDRKSAVSQAESMLAEKSAMWRTHIARTGPCTLGDPSPFRSHYEALARDIVFQQLAGKAAATIWGRVRLCVPGAFNAKNVQATPDEILRAAGMSANKLKSLRDLSEHVLDKRLKLHLTAKLDDEELIAELVAVRGIGRWTAQMFLMFRLGRPDVWPSGDLGVRNGYAKLHHLDPLPTIQELEDLGNDLRPVRSVAAWYCWRAADTADPGIFD